MTTVNEDDRVEQNGPLKTLDAVLRDWTDGTMDAAGTIEDLIALIDAASLQGADTVTEAPTAIAALDEIAHARWPSVNGDDPVKRIQAFALEALTRAAAPTAQDDTGARLGEGPVQDDDAEELRELARDAWERCDSGAAEKLERIASRLSADHTGVLVEALRPLSDAAPQGDWIIGEGTEVRAFDGKSTRWFGSFGDRKATQFAVAAVNFVRAALATARGEQSPVDGIGEPRE